MSLPQINYEVKTESVLIDKIEFTLRTLKDRQQYYDPLGIAEAAGISSATWSLFGVLWPSGVALARVIMQMNVKGLRVLEVGCGIALPSIVAASKGATVTASDSHPLAASFLEKNVGINAVPPIVSVTSDWRRPIDQLGRFDVIMGSDVLYEPDHAEVLASFIDCHASENAKIVIVDPGRNNVNRFSKHMKAFGYVCEQELLFSEKIQRKTHKIQSYTYVKA